MKKLYKDIFMYSLAGMIIILLFITVYVIIFVTIPPENEKLVYMALGTILTWGSLVVSYFFASSVGSARKEEMLNQQRNINSSDQ